jgi:hypothetical protein
MVIDALAATTNDREAAARVASPGWMLAVVFVDGHRVMGRRCRQRRSACGKLVAFRIAGGGFA